MEEGGECKGRKWRRESNLDVIDGAGDMRVDI
jgi:hypothetical protein